MLGIRTIVAAAALALVAGCGGVPGTATGGTPSPVGTETAEQPATEGPAPTATDPGPGPRPGGPTLTMPEVPIGRADGSDDSEGQERCVAVSYLGNSDIPAGVRIVVTKVRLEQKVAYFTAAGSGCAGRTACAGTDFTWTADSRNDACSVRLRETGKKKPSDDDGADPRLVLSASITCPAGQAAACAAFQEDVRDDDRQVRITPPFADDPSPTTDPTTTAGGN